MSSAGFAKTLDENVIACIEEDDFTVNGIGECFEHRVDLMQVIVAVAGVKTYGDSLEGRPSSLCGNEEEGMAEIS